MGISCSFVLLWLLFGKDSKNIFLTVWVSWRNQTKKNTETAEIVDIWELWVMNSINIGSRKYQGFFPTLIDKRFTGV